VQHLVCRHFADFGSIVGIRLHTLSSRKKRMLAASTQAVQCPPGRSPSLPVLRPALAVYAT
jgi:hypothetical protein